jgi:hypothetical protein
MMTTALPLQSYLYKHWSNIEAHAGNSTGKPPYTPPRNLPTVGLDGSLSAHH